MEELDRVIIVREGEFGCRSKLLQESSELGEPEKRIVKSETGRVILRQGRMSDGALACRTCRTKLKTIYEACRTKLKTIYEADLRALEFVPHSTSVERVCSVSGVSSSSLLQSRILWPTFPLP
jgi:hypothetical protein